MFLLPDRGGIAFLFLFSIPAPGVFLCRFFFKKVGDVKRRLPVIFPSLRWANRHRILCHLCLFSAPGISFLLCELRFPPFSFPPSSFLLFFSSLLLFIQIRTSDLHEFCHPGNIGDAGEDNDDSHKPGIDYRIVP